MTVDELPSKKIPNRGGLNDDAPRAAEVELKGHRKAPSPLQFNHFEKVVSDQLPLFRREAVRLGRIEHVTEVVQRTYSRDGDADRRKVVAHDVGERNETSQANVQLALNVLRRRQVLETETRGALTIATIAVEVVKGNVTTSRNGQRQLQAVGAIRLGFRLTCPKPKRGDVAHVPNRRINAWRKKVAELFGSLAGKKLVHSSDILSLVLVRHRETFGADSRGDLEASLIPREEVDTHLGR